MFLWQIYTLKSSSFPPFVPHNFAVPVINNWQWSFKFPFKVWYQFGAHFALIWHINFCCKVKGIPYFVLFPKIFLIQDLNLIVLLYKVMPSQHFACWCSPGAMLCYCWYITPVLLVLYNISVTSVIWHRCYQWRGLTGGWLHRTARLVLRRFCIS